MNESAEIYLGYKCDNLRRMIKLQREIIISGFSSITQPNPVDQNSFPRSETMRFLYSERGLLLAQMIAKLLMRRHPGTLSVIKTIGQLLLKKEQSKG